jgi:hypothetical protein
MIKWVECVAERWPCFCDEMLSGLESAGMAGNELTVEAVEVLCAGGQWDSIGSWQS